MEASTTDDYDYDSPSPEPSPTTTPTIYEDVSSSLDMESSTFEVTETTTTAATTNENGADEDALEDADGTSSCGGCSNSNPTSSSSHLHQEPECPICMEVFQVGECVSWSPSVKCEHVFHTQCIKEWLLRRIACPYCREIYLPVDRQKGRLPAATLSSMAKERAQRASCTYYCQVDGLVTLQALKDQNPKKKQQMNTHTNGVPGDDENDNKDDHDHEDDVSLKTYPHYLARRLWMRLRGGSTRRQVGTRRQIRRQLRQEVQVNYFGNETGLEILASSTPTTTTQQQQQQPEASLETMPMPAVLLVESPLPHNSSSFMEDDDDDDDDDDQSSEGWNSAGSETSVRRQLEFGNNANVNANLQNQTLSNLLNENVANDLEEGRMILMMQQDQSHKPSLEDSNHDHMSLGSSGTIVFETQSDENNDDDDDNDNDDTESSRDEEMGLALIVDLDRVLFHA
jgi:hypothetical protein